MDTVVSQAEEFDGFITPEGELVSIKDADRMFSILTKRSENVEKIKGMLHSLACECAETGYFDAASAYISRLLSLADTSGEKARCLLGMGQVLEQAHDSGHALEIYLKAFDLPQESNEIWYFLNNNAGYCLNAGGRYREAEMHCRAAIKIDRKRHNAHKNLAIALQGSGRYCDAARSFISAIIACPEDGRSLGHLEDLLAAHGEILEQEPGILERLRKCYEVAESTRGKPRLQ